MTPLTIVVTGGTGGIGHQTATTLAGMGHRVLVTGRDAARAAEAVDRIRVATGNTEVGVLLADLADMAAVDRLAGDIAAATDTVDVLINNAGVINHGEHTTGDGLELGFAVNVVAPVRLTLGLRDRLAAAPAARVVNVTGGAPIRGLDLQALDDPSQARGLGPYTNNKRALEAVSLWLADELRPDGTTVNVVYPGSASTSMTTNMSAGDLPVALRVLYPVFALMQRGDDGGASAAKASRSSVFAATDPTLDGRSGLYVTTKSKIGRFHRSVTDPAVQRRVAALLRAADPGAGAAGEEPSAVVHNVRSG